MESSFYLLLMFMFERHLARRGALLVHAICEEDHRKNNTPTSDRPARVCCLIRVDFNK